MSVSICFPLGTRAVSSAVEHSLHTVRPRNTVPGKTTGYLPQKPSDRATSRHKSARQATNRATGLESSPAAARCTLGCYPDIPEINLARPGESVTDPIILYRFRVRDAVTGKWHITRYALTEQEAEQRYGKGNYERLDWSKEVREGGDPGSLSAGHLFR
jgi:hypothetical protein